MTTNGGFGGVRQAGGPVPDALRVLSFDRQRGQKMSVTVYSKPACVQCTATTRALDAKGISYEVIDLTQDDDAMSHVAGLGYRQAPVVMAGEEHWSGFRPDKIARLA